MNLVNSKIMKSSRPLINRSVETVAAFSCELFIESFKISHRGYVYFVWNSNNSQIQSLRYESNGKLLQVKETLTISLRITSKNGKDVPTNTSLKLMAESGEELDEFQIPMNNLTAQFKQMEMPMDRGLVNLKIRRKIMNIGEQEDINFQGGFYRSMAHRIDDKSVTHMITGEYQSLQQELSRTKKELEDVVYLNNKLKNDRDVLMATKQELELEIESMIMQITKEISVLREHYENRISIREHSYEEEIEDLVNVFNSNAEQSKKTVQVILKQKIKLQDQMRPLIERLKLIELEIAQKNDEYSNLQKDKMQLEIHLTQIEEANFDKDREIELLNHQQGEMQGTINSQNIRIENLTCQIDKHKEQIDNLGSTIKGLEQKLSIAEGTSQQKNKSIYELQEKLINQQQRENGNRTEIELLKKEINLLEEDKKGFLIQIEDLNGRLQQFEYEMQFNENVMGQLKKQQTQKEEELYSQLQSLEKLYSQKMEDIISSFQREKDELISINQLLEQEKLDHEMTVKQFEDNIGSSDTKLTELTNELNNLSNQIKNTQENTQQKDIRIRQLQAELERLTSENLMNPTEAKFEAQEAHNKNVALEQTNKELLDRNKAMEEEIKRLLNQVDHLSKELQNLVSEKIKQEADTQRKSEKRSQKNSKHFGSERGVQNILGNGPFNQEEVREIVITKEREISELRRRVDYLQNLYDGLQFKFEEITKKYPQIDLGLLQVPKPQQWCDSEQEEQKVLNLPLFNSIGNEAQIVKKASNLSRKNSIGAIIEKDQEILSHQSKLATDRKSFEPRSEKRISDDYRRGISRRQSLGKATIELPRGVNSIRKEASHGSYDPSERSGQYIKVSHSKRIKDLQQDKKSLAAKIKKYEAEIQQYIRNSESLKQEVGQIRLEAIQRPQTPKREIVKESKESQVYFEDERMKNFMHESQLKEFEIQKMNLRMGELEDNLKIEKNQAIRKVSTLEIKLIENDKRYEEVNRRCEGLTQVNKNLQKLNDEWQQKLRKQKDSSQQVRLTVKQLQMHLDNAQNELKKTRTQKQVLEEKVQKLINSQSIIRQLSKEIEDQGKKALDQTRTINHLKLEKDAVEQELRLIKKRQNDHIRISTEWEEKAASLERAIEEQKRKQGKYKREIEEGHEELRRAKFNTKKAEEELQVLSSAQATWQAQRRKHLDQISNLQDQLSRRDYQYTKLNKQLEKWKMRAEEKQDMRMGKKSELREEINRLENQLIRRQKKILQESEQNKLLRGRLELLERQNKRMMEQKNQSYGQKLKYYVEQMSNIKKLLEEYQNQNSRLKIDNNELYEQLQLLRMSYDKLQMKYDENIEREESILTDLQGYINETNALKDRLAEAHSELDHTQAAFVSLRKEFDEEKLQFRKIGQKLDISERNLQRAMNQIRDLKIKVSEYETNNEINGKIGERYRLLERKKSQLEDEYRKIKSQYDNVINLFVFKREDLQKAVAEARAHERRLKDEQVQHLSEECSKTIASKTQRLQQQILDLYNENSRLRAQIQAIIEQNGRYKGRLSELQTAAERVGTFQDENESYKDLVEELKQELRKKNEKINKLDLSVQSIEAQCNSKERDISGYRNRIKQLEKSIEKLNIELQSRRSTERELQDALLKVGQSKNRQKSQQEFQAKQKQAQLIQQYESKIHNYELEMQKIKDRETRSVEENLSKMKKLQQKMDEMEEALRQRQKAIEGHYQTEMQELQSSLLRITQELEEKFIRIDELNDAIIILEGQNKDITKEMQDIKFQFEQQRQILQGELTRLKNKLKQAESIYAANLKSLEQEVIRSTQKTNVSGSRLKTNEAEDRIAKRYEQKLKNKDRKIEELKQSIYTLEQTIVKLKKKEIAYETTHSQIERLKLSILQFQKERKNIENKYEEEINRNSDTIRELKRQIILIKQSEERFKLIAEEKTFENESIVCELRTMRELYQELQRELEKRKNNLTNQLEEGSSLQLELRIRESRIIELEENLIQSMKHNKELEIDTKKKSTEIKRFIEIINEGQKNQQAYIEEITKLTNELVLAKRTLQELSNTSQTSKTEVNKMRTELMRLRKNQQQLRAACTSKQEAANQLKRIYDELSLRFKESEEMSSKYLIINQRSREHLGYSIQETVEKFIMHLEEKQAEINQLIQEVEELKFLNERKYLDYDELKKENFELQMKVEDMDVLNDQLESLRKICDKLEEEKKNSVFREEVLRMQLQNLANSGAPDLFRSRINAILSNPSVPSFTNFSFY